MNSDVMMVRCARVVQSSPPFVLKCFKSTLCQGSPVQSTLCASECFDSTLCQRVVQSNPPFVLQNVLTVHCAIVVQTTLCA